MQSGSEWEDRYQQGQTGWDRGEVSPNLTYWLEQKLLEPCRILIPGCGNGYEVLALAKKGFDVVAIDIAPSAIKNLSKALESAQLSAELFQTDFFSWKLINKVDAIYEQTSLCALNPKQWQKYEQCLFDWLTPRGKVFAQFMQTGQEGGPPYHCDIETMTELFSVYRWQWSARHESDVVHSGNFYEKMYLLDKVV